MSKENGNIKVSVIMPVFNAEEFLKPCLDSVVSQTLSDIEIICVDDGSTDNSLKILEEYAKRDKRISILSQKNCFAGVARNNGLKKAGGKYVVFWDSDDLFDKRALKLLYDKCEQDSAEICVCSAVKLNSLTGELIGSNAYLEKDQIPEYTPFSKEDIPATIFNFATNVPWNKMFLREFLQNNNLQFQDIRQANDTFFVLMALFLAERITVVDEVLITYRFNNAGSLTGKASDSIFCAYDSYVYTAKKLMEHKEFSGEVRRSFINRALRGFLFSLHSQDNYESFSTLYDKYKNEGFANFGIEDFGEEFYHLPGNYNSLQKMLTMDSKNFLIKSLREKTDSLALRMTRIAELKDKKAKLTGRVEELKQKTLKLTERNTALNEQNTVLKQRVADKNKIIEEKQAILDRFSVRLALKVVKIFTFGKK